MPHWPAVVLPAALTLTGSVGVQLPAPPGPRGSPAERILSSALAEFSRRGFDRGREFVIARRAGVSAATLRNYFPSKEDLFLGVIRSVTG